MNFLHIARLEFEIGLTSCLTQFSNAEPTFVAFKICLICYHTVLFFYEDSDICFGSSRRKIRLIVGNAKCCHLKKVTCKVTLRQVFICLRPSTPYHAPPPPQTLCVYTVCFIAYSHREGGERRGRLKPERLEWQQFTKLGRKYQHD